MVVLSGKRWLQFYLSSIGLVALVMLVYEAYSMLSSMSDHYCVYNYCGLYDREKTCNGINMSVDHSCREPSCSDRLSPTNRRNFTECFNNTWWEERDERYIHRGCCRFMSSSGERETVVLASYPGSGNTWVRGLLESITGLCTGSIYCDTALRRRGFIGESVIGPEVLVVKTHRKDSWMENKPAIYIIRDPVRAIISYWNFRSTATHSHRKTQPLTSFVNNTDWIKFFQFASNSWQRFLLGWTTNRPQSVPLLVVSYEALLEDTLSEVERIMQFLRLPVPVERKDLEEWVKNDFSIFQRRTHMQLEQYYTPQQWRVLLDMLTRLHETLRKQGQTHLAAIVLSYLNEHSGSELPHHLS